MKQDSRPQRYSWAPGEYLCTCFSCHEAFAGDKRAGLCADCAYALPDPGTFTAAQFDADLAEGCGDCDPCIGGRPDQCAVGGIAAIEFAACPVCHGINEGTGFPPCPKCDDAGEVPKTTKTNLGHATNEDHLPGRLVKSDEAQAQSLLK